MDINRKHLTLHEDVMTEELKDPAFRKVWEAGTARREVVKMIMSERIRRNMSQADLAKRAGLKQPNVARIESGSRGVSIETLSKIARAFGKQLRIVFEQPAV